MSLRNIRQGGIGRRIRRSSVFSTRSTPSGESESGSVPTRCEPVLRHVIPELPVGSSGITSKIEAYAIKRGRLTSFYVAYLHLVDADKRPAAAVIVASQMERMISVCERQYLRQLVTSPDSRPDAAVDELDSAALILHFARDGAQIAAKAHAEYGDWYVK